MTVEIISRSISTKVWDRAGIELATPGIAVRHASVARHVTDCATRPDLGLGLRGWDGGMMKLWIFLGGYRKTGLFLGVISKHSRVFS